MSSQQYTNQAVSTLGLPYTSGASSLTLSSGTGSAFPATGNFTIGINDPPSFYLLCTARTGDVLIVGTAGSEGTVAVSMPAGAVVAQVLSAGTIDSIRKDMSALGVYSSLPTTGMKSGDRYKCTDSVYDFIYDGTTWQAFAWGMHVYVPPPYSSWTWMNQGSATANSNSGIVAMQDPAVGVYDNMNILMKPLPAAPYTIDFLIWCDPNWTNNNYFGTCLVDTVSGKLVNVQWTFQNGTSYFYRFWNSPTSYAGAYGSDAAPFTNNPFWWRITDDGTAYRNFYFSIDGTNWRTILPVNQSRTSWITPNMVGWFCSPMSATCPMNILLVSYREQAGIPTFIHTP